MKFRVFNDYDYVIPSPSDDEGEYIVPVVENGYKDVEIDYLGEHKNFYLMLANCMDIDESTGDGIGVPMGDGDDWIGLVNKKLFPLIEQFGNLGCSPIEIEREITNVHTIEGFTYTINGMAYTTPTPTYPIFEVDETVISRRKPSKVDNEVYIAQPDFYDGIFSLEAIDRSPSLYKAIWDLKRMLTDFREGKKVNLDILNAHLTQCNVISVTDQKEVNGRYFYETVPYVDNLLGLAFWQFQQLLLENNPGKIAVCAMCGNYFEKKSHKGRFCNETITGAYGEQTKLNACTSRYNSLKTRVKKNYVKDASLTIDDLAKKHRCSIELITEFVEQWQKDGIQRNN